jgi:GNAT superfamily N-acetyltransferase
MNELERIEFQGMRGWYDAVSAAGLSDYGWELVEVGDAVCSVSTSEPSILINRVFGLGSERPPTLDQLVEIRAVYERANVARFFLHVVPESFGAHREELLTSAGFSRHRAWMKFTRGPGEIPTPRTDLTIRRIGPDRMADFAAIVVPAFDMTAASLPALATLADNPDWHPFMSFADDRPAGTGGLFVRDGLGYLDCGATHPDFRRRGSQSAILSARLELAYELGCSTVATMTGEAVPGDPQHSYSNILRAGFVEAYLRENWIPSAS